MLWHKWDQVTTMPKPVLRVKLSSNWCWRVFINYFLFPSNIWISSIIVRFFFVMSYLCNCLATTKYSPGSTATLVPMQTWLWYVWMDYFPLFELTCFNLPAQWLMDWGSHCQALEPQDLPKALPTVRHIRPPGRSGVTAVPLFDVRFVCCQLLASWF